MSKTVQTAAIRQVSDGNGQDLRPRAVLRLKPRDISDRYGISFQRDIDDLDGYEWAIIEVNGRRFWLLRYERNPYPGTEVLTERAQERRANADLSLLAAVLRLKNGDFKWRSGSQRERRTSAARASEQRDPKAKSAKGRQSRIDVTPARGGGWDARTMSQSGPDTSHHSTQAAALAWARRSLKRAGGGKLVIHGKDGTVRAARIVRSS